MATSWDEDRVAGDLVEQLAALLPGWNVTASVTRADDQSDAMVELQAPDHVRTRVLVDVRTSFAPRDTDRLADRLRYLRRVGGTPAPVMVAAPWLSPRTRERLEALDVNWWDPTGNLRLVLARPSAVLRTTGSLADPLPRARTEPSLRGAAAGRVIRAVVDTTPPLTTSEVAQLADVSIPWASRVLVALEREALVTRERGRVREIDWPALLRVRAASYDLLSTNSVAAYVAPRGPEQAFGLLADGRAAYRAVTGSFAARLLAPVAASTQLAVYADDALATAAALDLLPTSTGADVLLLRARDRGVLTGAGPAGPGAEGVTVVAPSQLVLDCLTGPGRLPAEGEAVLAWMAAEPERWRRPSPSVHRSS